MSKTNNKRILKHNGIRFGIIQNSRRKVGFPQIRELKIGRRVKLLFGEQFKQSIKHMNIIIMLMILMYLGYDNFFNIREFFPIRLVVTLVNVQVGEQVDLLSIMC